VNAEPLPATENAVTAAPEKFDRRLIAPMVLGSILNPVNSSMIAVALIPIGTYFGAPPAQTAWLVSGLYLATAVGQPVVGRLVDTFGPRRLYLIGTALVGVAGVLGALAPNLGVLVAARVLLGFGTCAGYPAAMFLIRSEARRTGEESPNGILTTLAVASQTIAVAGPTVGGLLIGVLDWRALFTVNIPLAVIAFVLGVLRLPQRDPPAQRVLAGLDLPGIGLFAATLVSLLLLLMDPTPGRWWLLLIAAAAGAGFTVRELRTAAPFVDLRLLAGNAPLVATYLRNLLSYVVAYGFLYGFTQWAEEARGLSAAQTGLVTLPIFVTGIAISTITGRRSEVRGKLLVGASAQVLACVLLLALHASSGIWLLLVIAAVAGIPQGLNNLANQNALYHQAEAARIGSSAGLLRTFMYLGAIIASAANGGFYGSRADTPGLHHLAWFMLAVAALFLAFTLADRSLRHVGKPG
jgi:MFS family permease